MNDEVWRAIVECDSTYDGQIYYGLITTGIFCKPSCKSKTPIRENVKIFNNPADAKMVGLRPCKRCRPEDLFQLSSDVELVDNLVRLINDLYYEPLTLNEMASKLYVSPFYLQKRFKRIIQMSPAKFLTMKRMEIAKSLLKETQVSITNIAMQVGFRSNSHFSSVFHKEAGYSPTEYRNHMKSKLKNGVSQ